MPHGPAATPHSSIGLDRQAVRRYAKVAVLLRLVGDGNEQLVSDVFVELVV